MIKAVLFDLDGTLISIDIKRFFKRYFGDIAAHAAKKGFDPALFLKALQAGTEAMLKNDGTQTNEKVYWDCFQRVFGNAGDEEQALFMNYYLNEYQDCLKESCGKIDGAAAVVHGLREKGILLALATNPLFPIEAVSKRIAFSGLSPDDFDCVTTYDWCRFSKPNPNYYLEVSKKLSVPPEQCLMVGNDAADDMPAESIGMQTFLVTDCLEHTTTEDIQNHPHGTMKDLLDFIQSESA